MLQIPSLWISKAVMPLARLSVWEGSLSIRTISIMRWIFTFSAVRPIFVSIETVLVLFNWIFLDSLFRWIRVVFPPFNLRSGCYSCCLEFVSNQRNPIFDPSCAVDDSIPICRKVYSTDLSIFPPRKRFCSSNSDHLPSFSTSHDQIFEPSCPIY